MNKEIEIREELLRELRILNKFEEGIENKQNPIDPKTSKTLDMENHENTWIEELSCSSYTKGRLSMIDDIREIIEIYLV